MTRLNQELGGLPDVYRSALEYDHSALREVLAEVAHLPAVFSGSGGALAVAELAAQLHRQTSARPARAATPLGLAADAGEREAAAVLFTASGRNPDVRLGARAARLGGWSAIGVWCVWFVERARLPGRWFGVGWALVFCLMMPRHIVGRSVGPGVAGRGGCVT